MLQVVTDSSCDLPDEVLSNNGVSIVPLSIEIDGRLYLEREELSTHDFYASMDLSRELPKTSQPSPAAFAEKFAALSARGQVLCLTVSSALSGTFQSACLGRDLSQAGAYVFDTLSASIGHGLQVLKACELACAGAELDEVVAKLTEYRNSMKTLVLLNTLENIVKGGRLSRFQGSISNILDIRVLLHDVEGMPVLLEKVRGRRKLMDLAIRTVRGLRPDLTGRDVGISHFENAEDAEYLSATVKAEFNPRDVYVAEMGPALATYAGRSGLILAF